ncbi:hypothetical protein [Collimonas sp. OK412]|jgi:hypothetical protein|uniref:hypothetical protein n=1 Tax=Collimonas sp. (strain OK412) TaxID=1801619 RepID=UPI001113A07C|nr:hypothetical protein [Collimonas sp. OK412]
MMRLETVSPMLAEKIQTANSDQRRAASLLACQLVIKITHIEDRNVLEALDLLQKNGNLSPLKRAELDDFSAQLDEEYFELQNKAEDDPAVTPDYLLFFGQARAVSALSFAGSEDSFLAAMESIYEASVCVDDNSKIFDAVLRVLATEI